MVLSGLVLRSAFLPADNLQAISSKESHDWQEAEPRKREEDWGFYCEATHCWSHNKSLLRNIKKDHAIY